MCFKMKVCDFFSLFTLLCVGLCGSSTHAGNCTAPVLSVASLEVEYGQPANVTCSIQKKPDARYKLGWESKSSQNVTENETSVTWEVKELTNWEEPEGIKCFLTVDGVKDQCVSPLNLTIYRNCTAPVLSVASLEVEYGQPANVTCSIQKKPDARYKLGWESKSSQNVTENETSVTWEVKELTNWEEPEGIKCFLTVDGVKDQCVSPLNLTIYKKPDSVNLRSSSEVCVEGKQIELRCEVVNVGPGLILSVRWSRADPKQNTFTIFNEGPVPELKNEKKNVSKTVNLTITPTREDDDAQYQCEALLNLNQPLVFKSEKPITISVHYKKNNFYWLLFLLTVPIVLVIWAFIHYRHQRIGQYILRHLGVSHANQNTDRL